MAVTHTLHLAFCLTFTVQT